MFLPHLFPRLTRSLLRNVLLASLSLEQVRGSVPVRLRGLESHWDGAATAWGQGDQPVGRKGQLTIAELYKDAPLVSRWSEGSYLFGLQVRPTTMAQVRGLTPSVQEQYTVGIL